MISVCMAVYNGENYIKEQVESILKQLSKFDELIVVNDCSTDNSIAILTKFNDSRIRIYDNKNNLGPMRSFEHALNTARGDYIYLADQDDVWCSNKVSLCQAYLEDGNDLVVHDATVVDRKLNVLSHSWNQYNHNHFSSCWFLALCKNPFTGANMAFKRDMLKYILPFPKGIPMHDWWIGSVCRKRKVRIKVVNEALILYRRHGNNVTGYSHDLAKMFLNRYRLLLALWRV